MVEILNKVFASQGKGEEKFSNAKVTLIADHVSKLCVKSAFLSALICFYEAYLSFELLL